MRHTRGILSLMFLAVASGHEPVSAQRGVAPGDRVRVIGPSGRRIAYGVLEEMGPDSLIIGGRTPARVATSLFVDPDYLLQVRTGSQAAKGALILGSVFGGLGFWAGYCIRPLFSTEEGCAKNARDGFGAGAVFGTVGVIVGSLFGLGADRYEPVGPELLGGDLRTFVAPTAGGGLTFAMSLSLGSPGR